MESMAPIDVYNAEDNFDSSTSPQSPSVTSTTDCKPLSPNYSPIHSSEEQDVYIQEEEEEPWRYDPDPRLEIIDKQFNLKMKELFLGHPVAN